MHSDPLIDILAELDCSAVERGAKRAVMDIIFRVAGQYGMAAVMRMERLHFARQLLAQQVEKSTLIQAIKAKYFVSERTAYYDYEKALELRKETQFFCKTKAQNWSDRNND